MRLLVASGLSALLVGILAAAAAAQGAPVVPGQAIGDLRLGQDVDGVLTSLGPLHSQDTLANNLLTGYYWPLRRLGAIAEKSSHRIVALVVSLDDTYKTDKGITAGSDLETVRAAYGQEDAVDSHPDDETLVYDKLGVAFVVDKSGALGSRVSIMFVFNPGRYREIFMGGSQ